MLGGNSEEKSAKGTVWFADFKIEEGKIVQTTTGIQLVLYLKIQM